VTKPPSTTYFGTKKFFRGLHVLNLDKKSYDIVILAPPTQTWIRLDGQNGPPFEIIAVHEKYKHLLSENAKNKTKPIIYTFTTLNNFEDLIVLAGPLVAPGGHLVAMANTVSLDKYNFLDQMKIGFERLNKKMQKDIKEYRCIKKRQQLRIRGFTKKERKAILLQTDFEPTTEEIKTMYNFEKVDEWGPPEDFTIKSNIEQDMHSHYVFVFERKPLPPKIKKEKMEQQKIKELLKKAMAPDIFHPKKKKKRKKGH